MSKDKKITDVKSGQEVISPLDTLVSLPPIALNEITFGDSLELAGCVPAKADLILEDMPYNTTVCDWDKEPIDLKKYWESRMELIKPTGVICLTASQPFTSKLVFSNYQMFKYDWCWRKSNVSGFLNAKKRPLRQHEEILIFSKNTPRYFPQYFEKQSIRKPQKTVKRENQVYGKYEEGVYRTIADDKGYPRSVIEFSTAYHAREAGLHPTQKPVGLFEYLIRTYTNEGELVFDGFGGSGTTAIAAYRTKRNFIVIEKDKRYFEIASKRLYQERNPLSTFDEAS